MNTSSDRTAYRIGCRADYQGPRFGVKSQAPGSDKSTIGTSMRKQAYSREDNKKIIIIITIIIIVIINIVIILTAMAVKLIQVYGHNQAFKTDRDVLHLRNYMSA